jgi:putative hydrolase of the HAD superfamily
MKVRRFDAAIFDFFGTLVYNRPWGNEMNRVVADTLGAPVDDFLREWARTGKARTLGAYDSIEQNVQQVCKALGVQITDEQAKRAAEIRLDYTRRNLIPKEGALDLLGRLHEMRYKLGLLSNCTPEVPVVWREMVFAPLFDDAVFSCAIHIAKPRPEAFELAGRGVETAPERCMYVADNADEELEGAKAAGMFAVRLLPAEGEWTPRGAELWEGPCVEKLLDVLNLLD